MQSVSFEVVASLERPFYSTEFEKTIDISDKDYRAICRASDWDDLPEEIYDRIHRKVVAAVGDDLSADGMLDEDAEADDVFLFYVQFPFDEEEEEDEDMDD